jgi:hypothetical protein
VIEIEHGIVLARAYELFDKGMLKSFVEAGIIIISILSVSEDSGLIIRNLKKDTTHNEEETLYEIYRHFRPAELLNSQKSGNFLFAAFGIVSATILVKLAEIK